MSDKKITELITFLDSAQRTIIAEKLSEDDNVLEVSNPVVVNIMPQMDEKGRPTNGMALQLLPVYFREFQSDKSAAAIFKYNKNSITSIKFEHGFDFRLYGQYERLFKMQEEQKPETPVVDLSDDKE